MLQHFKYSENNDKKSSVNNYKYSGLSDKGSGFKKIPRPQALGREESTSLFEESHRHEEPHSLRKAMNNEMGQQTSPSSSSGTGSATTTASTKTTMTVTTTTTTAAVAATMTAMTKAEYDKPGSSEVASEKPQQQTQIQETSPRAVSENSRGFEPEGSVDMSTPYSESLAPTPPYLKWAEDIQNLLGDPDGVKLYQNYLEQENLGHLLKFWFACEGLKKQDDEKTISKYVRVINRNFICTKMLDIDERVKKGIQDKIASKVGIDKNVFDGAQEHVKELMIHTTYPNFLKSEVYLNYIQLIQNRECDVITGSQSSTASSISGRGHGQDGDSGHVSMAPTIPPKPSAAAIVNAAAAAVAAAANASASVGSTSSTSATVTATTTSGHGNNNNPPPDVSASTSGISEASSSNLRNNSSSEDSVHSVHHHHTSSSNATTAATDMHVPYSVSTATLPTLHEHSELNLETAASAADEMTPTILTKEALLSTQKRRQLTSGLPAAAAAANLQEIHSVNPQNPQNPSFPYHAFGSAYNPVSRQDSEIQSQSSGGVGGGGDTTDDNYSSFTEGSSFAQMSERMAKKNRHRQKIEQRRMKENLMQNKEDRQPTIPRPNRQGQGPPYPMSTEEFANQLIRKLQAHLDAQEREKKSFETLKKKLSSVEASSGSFSKGNKDDLESDQSILDEHVSRIWQDKTPVLRSPGDMAGRPRTPPPLQHASFNKNTLSRLSTSMGTGGAASSSALMGPPPPSQGSSGHHTKTLPNRRMMMGFQVQQHQPHQQQQQQPSFAYYQQRQHMHPIAGDLAFYNHQSNVLHKSYNDLEGVRSLQPPLASQSSLGSGDRVREWVQNVNVQSQYAHEEDQRSSRSCMKTSPKSSRHFGSSKHRARSQDRLHSSWSTGVTGSSGVQPQPQPPPIAPAQSLFSSSSGSNFNSTTHQLQEVNRRLHEHHNHQRQPAFLFQQQQQLRQQQQQTKVPVPFTTVMYTFSNEPEGMPYRVKILTKAVTLKNVKDNLPKGGRYRYYFKTLVDGEPCFEEERDPSALVPLWDEGKVVVQCRDDVI